MPWTALCALDLSRGQEGDKRSVAKRSGAEPSRGRAGCRRVNCALVGRETPLVASTADPTRPRGIRNREGRVRKQVRARARPRRVGDVASIPGRWLSGGGARASRDSRGESPETHRGVRGVDVGVA